MFLEDSEDAEGEKVVNVGSEVADSFWGFRIDCLREIRASCASSALLLCRDSALVFQLGESFG